MEYVFYILKRLSADVCEIVFDLFGSEIVTVYTAYLFCGLFETVSVV